MAPLVGGAIAGLVVLLFRDALPEARWADEDADVYGGEPTELEGVGAVEELTIDVVSDDGAPSSSGGSEGPARDRAGE